MKFPKSWHDKSLLEDEPFLSAFQTFLPDGSDTGNNARISKLKSEVVNAVKEMKSGNRIVDTWLKYAFIPYPPGKRKGISVQVDYKTRRLFVEFYWHLSRNEDSALKLLNQERIPRGLKAFPPGTSPCGAGQKVPVSPAAPKKKPLPTIAVPSSIPQRSDWKRPVGAHLKDMHFKKKSTSVDGIQVQSKSLEKEPETLRISTRISTNKPTTPLDLQPVKMSPSPQPSNETPPSDVPPLVQNPRKRALSGPDGRVVKRRALANPTGPLLERNLPAKREQVNGPSTKILTASDNSEIRRRSVRKAKPPVQPYQCQKLSQAIPENNDSVVVKAEAISDTVGKVSRKKRGRPPKQKSDIVGSVVQGKAELLESNLTGSQTIIADESASSQGLRLSKKRPANTSDNRETRRRSKRKLEPQIQSDQQAVLPNIIRKDIDPSVTGKQSLLTASGNNGDSLKKKAKKRRDRTTKAKASNVSALNKSTCSIRGNVPYSETRANIKEEISVPAPEGLPPFTPHKQSIPPASPGLLPPGRTDTDDKGIRTRKPVPDFPFATTSPETPQTLLLKEERQTPSPVLDHSEPKFPFVHSPTESEDIESMVLISDSSIKDETDHIAHVMQYFPPEEFPPVPQKPPLVDLPPIWAQSRQEICESFDWFRSYQGGVYHAHDIVKGYLLSGFPSSRDRFEHGGRLIISHGGGKSESMHFSKGHVSCVLASDQLAQDKSVRALLNNYRSNRPLALLIDDKYALFPYDLGSKDVAYAVLGFYTVAHVWAEYQVANNESGRVVRYKFAFRWCEDQGWPWWIERSNFVESPTTLSLLDTTVDLPECQPSPTKVEEQDIVDSPPLSDKFISGDEEVITCGYCQEVSPRVFSLCWVCLTPHCRMFWRQTEGKCSGHCLPDGLDYHPSFLELPPCKPIPSGFQIIKPFLPTETSPSGTITNYFFTRGFHCAECGRLSCRSQWEKWQCAHCNNPLRTESTLCRATDIWNQALPITFKDNLLNAISDITQSSSASFIHEGGRGLIHSFILPERRGRIHHIQSGTPNGWKEADDIFLEYQKQASSGTLRFRRWPMRAHKCRGALLTNYFSHNAGEPYKYVGGDANTVPFDSAPAVCKARGLIQKRIKQALGISAEFNEVLSVAYMERQKMAFHSDNEVGLGPLVAGLSLGSPALMHFRIHAKHDPEREKRGILLSIVLRHGDVLVMDGAGVQEYYEHTVVPNNFRIAATARQIGSTHA